MREGVVPIFFILYFYNSIGAFLSSFQYHWLWYFLEQAVWGKCSILISLVLGETFSIRENCCFSTVLAHGNWATESLEVSCYSHGFLTYVNKNDEQSSTDMGWGALNTQISTSSNFPYLTGETTGILNQCLGKVRDRMGANKLMFGGSMDYLSSVSGDLPINYLNWQR